MFSFTGNISDAKGSAALSLRKTKLIRAAAARMLLPGGGQQCQGMGGQWDLDSLLQELVLALVGYTGDIFVDSSTDNPSSAEIEHPDRCTISLALDIVLADDVNREELLRLVQMGFHFKQIKQFIQQEQQPATESSKSKYRCALCSGLDEVLCLYEDEVVLLQDRLLQQQGLDKGLPGIAYELADMQRLLVHVHYMVYELRRRNSITLGLSQAEPTDSTSVSNNGLVVQAQFCGARLLQWLQDRKAHGEPLLRLCTQRLMWHVYQVFFNQLTTWMVHGLLLDGGNEFLIKLSAEGADSKGAEGAGTAAAAAAAGADTDAVRDGGSGGSKPSAGSADCMDMALMTEADTYRDFHSAFVVDNLQLPPGLSTHTAASIEFVGRAVRLLKSAPASAKLREMQDAWGSYNQHQLQLQEALAGLSGLQGGSSTGAGGGMPQQLLPYGDAMAYAAALRLLQDQPEYSPGALERTVEAIRADVASRLWQLVVIDSRLVDHLAALKDYLLLAKGDFWTSFLVNAARQLSLPAGTKVDLVVPWQSAASNSTAADDPQFKFFTLQQLDAARQQQQQQQQQSTDSAAMKAGRASLSVSADMASGPGLDGRGSSSGSGQALEVLDCLQLNARLPWPLGVLITPRHLDEYNALFGLLLKVKRVQLDLETAWQELGRLCGRKGGGTQARDIGELLQLRQYLGHVMGNLQLYLQLDVIETNYEWLLGQVAAAQDFREVQDAHDRFVHMLKMQSLIYSVKMMGHINSVLLMARRLCGLVRGAREGGIDMEGVQEVKQEFFPLMRNVGMALRSKTLRKAGAAPSLNLLYERLNYNGFLSRHMAVTTGVR